MKFFALGVRSPIPANAKNNVFLVADDWDDWFKFSTAYEAFYSDSEGASHRIGTVKIGQFAMTTRRPELPKKFEVLDAQFFSVGQDDSYYQNLNNLGPDFRTTYLNAMRDLAADQDLFERALLEEVTGVSLLRFISDKSVRGQFRRMTKGGARLTSYKFLYVPEPWGRNNPPPTFIFRVVPESLPPRNVHVLIGRNGVGKTHIINQMTNALVRPNEGQYGQFEWQTDDDEETTANSFSNIISVTFSAFDPFEPISSRENKLSSVRYHYIGLKYIGKDADGNPRPPKTPQDLASDFGKSVEAIVIQHPKRDRWKRALTLLESDTLFKRSEFCWLIERYDELVENLETREALKILRHEARLMYSMLSSGHKIVLLIITRVVETLEERSLVLVDEPEAHLHPPLLSALIRAFSDLLIDRNAVAIIATHSPVILQEVPKNCVWRIRRSGNKTVIERPKIETFGENVGTLTDAIFGLEVTDSGFHKLLTEVVQEGLSYDEVIIRFGNQLGDEARSIVRSLIASRQN